MLCVLYSMFYILWFLSCILYGVSYVVFSIFYVLCPVFCILCSMFCILYSTFCIIAPPQPISEQHRTISSSVSLFCPMAFPSHTPVYTTKNARYMQ